MRIKSLLILTSIVLVSGILPVFAEVTEIQLDSNFYLNGDSINVKGTVTEDSSGLVSIVIRDPADGFVLLSQAIIQSDNSFEKDITINNKFQVPGTHNATAFILNMTAGKTQSFNFDLFSLNSDIQQDKDLDFILTEMELDLQNDSEITNVILQPVQKDVEPPIVNNPQTKNPQIKLDESVSQIADFVDKTKRPEYYLDRYYSEPVYKSWFDRNYPNITIEEAVGFTSPPEQKIKSIESNARAEIIPEAEAISTEFDTSDLKNNSDLAQMGLAVGGLVVLFGAVYGIKRKVDNNTKHITLNKDLIRRKILSPIIDSNPLVIIKTRLAKGEISIEEYEKLKLKLENNSR